MKIWSYVTIDMPYPICDLNQSCVFGVYMYVCIGPMGSIKLDKWVDSRWPYF